MDAIDCILTRRSIRKYTGNPIGDDQLCTVLRAGMSAPTAANLRPWRFVVIRDAETIRVVSNAHPSSKMLPQAGCGILVCGDITVNKILYYAAQDCSAAIENMLLAAHALGLGAVWLGAHPEEKHIEEISKLLELPENIKPVGLIAMGDPDEVKDAPDRYDESMVHYEKW